MNVQPNIFNVVHEGLLSVASVTAGVGAQQLLQQGYALHRMVQIRTARFPKTILKSSLERIAPFISPMECLPVPNMPEVPLASVNQKVKCPRDLDGIRIGFPSFTPQRAEAISRISDLDLLLVRILRFSCLMRNELASNAARQAPVSYTHLTLPTILRV